MNISKADKLKAFLDSPEKIEPIVSEISIPLICQLWAARILVRLNLAARVASQFSYSDAEILSELGIETPAEPVAADLSKTFVAKLNSIDPALAHMPAGLKSNIQQLGKLVNLSDTEQAALCFIVLLKSYRSLEAVVGLVGDLARSYYPLLLWTTYQLRLSSSLYPCCTGLCPVFILRSWRGLKPTI